MTLDKAIKNLTTAERVALWLRVNHPSDEIVLDEPAFAELRNFYDRVDTSGDAMYDIIVSRTIPLEDFRLIISPEGVSPNTMRFVMVVNEYDDWESLPDGDTILVGAIQASENGRYALLGVSKGDMKLHVSDRIYNINGEEVSDIGEMDLNNLWNTWCAIQLALLHPKVKEVFSHPRKVKQYTREKDPETGKRKRVVRYVKRHDLNGKEVHNKLKEINRHCLCWYVIGHWRHYKNGKSVYIKGYWKGELRELERNLDKGRHRKLAIEKGA